MSSKYLLIVALFLLALQARSFPLYIRIRSATPSVSTKPSPIAPHPSPAHKNGQPATPPSKNTHKPVKAVQTKPSSNHTNMKSHTSQTTIKANVTATPNQDLQQNNTITSNSTQAHPHPNHTNDSQHLKVPNYITPESQSNHNQTEPIKHSSSSPLTGLSNSQDFRQHLGPPLSTVAIIGAIATVLIGLYVVWSKSTRRETTLEHENHSYEPVQPNQNQSLLTSPSAPAQGADGWNDDWQEDDWDVDAPAAKV